MVIQQIVCFALEDQYLGGVKGTLVSFAQQMCGKEQVLQKKDTNASVQLRLIVA